MLTQNPMITDDNAAVILPESSHDEVSFQDVFLRVSKLSLQMTASYTFSFQMVFLVYILSQLDQDEDHLAAITLITSLITTIVLVGISPLLPISLIAGNEVGELHEAEKQGMNDFDLQSKRDHIAAIYRNGLFISVGMLPIMASSMVFSKSILTGLFRQNEAVSVIAEQFIRPYAIALPGIMLRMCSEQVMFAFGRTKPAMLIGLSNFTLCMSLGSLLAVGYLGMPHLGKNGVLIGCIVESYLTAMAYSVYIAHDPRFKSFDFFNLNRSVTPYIPQLQRILKMSKFIFFAMVIETTLDLMTSVLAGIVGTKEQAALSVTMQFSLFSLLLQAAFGQTVSQDMSRELGENHFSTVSYVGKYGLLTSLMFTTPIPLVLAIHPSLLLSLTGGQSQATHQTLRYLAPIIFSGNILDAARYNMLQQLRVLGDTRRSSFISSTCLTFGIGTSAILAFKTDLGIYGVAMGYAFGITLASLFMAHRWVNHIDAARIEDYKKNPRPKTPITACCSTFFERFQGNTIPKMDVDIGTEMKEALSL